MHNVNYINICWLNDLVRILQKYGVKMKLRNNPSQKIRGKMMLLSWITSSPIVSNNSEKDTSLISRVKPYSPKACKESEHSISLVNMIDLLKNDRILPLIEEVCKILRLIYCSFTSNRLKKSFLLKI